MPIIKHLLSFAAGELSPWLDGRTDLDKYTAGCRSLLNFIALPQGAIQKRPGMEYLGSMDAAATAGRLVEFQVSTTEAAMLVLGGDLLAVYADGAPALDTGVPIVLAMPWADADLELLRWRQINSVCYFVHPSYPPHKLTRYAADDWELVEVDYSLSPALLPENLDSDHTVSTVFTVGGTPAAWSSAAVTYAAGDRVTYTSKTWVCLKGHLSGATKAPGTGTATYTESVIVAGRVTQTVTKPLWVEGFSDTSAVIGQVIGLTASRDTWQAGHAGAVFEISKKRAAADYETKIKAISANNGLYSPTIVVQGGWTFETYGTWKGTFTLERSTDRGATWEEVRAFEGDGERNVSTEGTEEKRVLMRTKWTHGAGGSSDPRGVLAASDALIRGLVRVTAVTDARTASAEVLTPVELTTTDHWAESAWNDVQGYPGVVELHQARVVMAATTLKPHTVWGSAADDYEKFYPGLLADEGYRHTVAIGERDPILWLVSERFLLIGTGSGEWIMHGEDEEKAIVPEFGVAKRHSSYGSHNGGVPACFADSVSLFVQRGGTRVREFSYRFEADRYEAANLNLLAEHLFTGPVEDIAVQRMPWQVVWFVSGGKLYGLTYERAQNVAAWHRHETEGDILSVGTIRATGTEDEVWFLVDRGQGAIFIERFRPGHMDALPDDGWWQDSAVAVPSPFDLTDAAHLDGLDATGWLAGEFFGPATVDGANWPFTTGMDVAGLGALIFAESEANANGLYVPSGTRDGRPYYEHATAGKGFFIQWIESRAAWVIFLAWTDLYFSTEDVASPDLVTAWDYVTADPGADPVLTARLIEPGEYYAQVVTGTLVPDQTGTYYVNGTLNGRPRYWRDNLSSAEISWSGTAWRIRVGGGAYWVGGQDVPTPDLVTTWTPQDVSITGTPVLAPLELLPSSDMITGLPYTAAVQPMTPEIPLANGSSRSREMRIHRVALSLRHSRGGRLGETQDGPGDPIDAGDATATFTGEIEKEFDGGHDIAGNVTVVSEEPFPFAIRTLALKANVYGDAD
jgi:hypothetical protein